MNPEFSIIVPLYNQEKYIEECIQSVINQTFNNFELIIINDGSTDKSESICTRYLNKDSRIKFIHKENEGVSIARNLGMKYSTGKYLFFLDSDDTIETQFLEKLHNKFVKTQSDFLIIGEYFCREKKELIGALPVCGFSFKKELSEEYQEIIFPEKLQPCEDGIFSHKLLAVADKVEKCPEAKYFYRKHSNSSEHTLSTQKILNDIPIWLDNLSDFYDKYNLWNKKRTHFLAFIKNEPFGLRFLKMPFTQEEKKYLFNLLHCFIKDKQLDIKIDSGFPKIFKQFLKAKSYDEFLVKIMKKHKKIKINFCGVKISFKFNLSGKSILKNIAKKVKKNNINEVYILTYHSGEIYLFLLLAKNIINKSNVLLVATKNYHIDLIKMFCPNAKYILYPDAQIFLDYDTSAITFKNLCYFNIYNKYNQDMLDESIILTDRIKKYLYKQIFTEKLSCNYEQKANEKIEPIFSQNTGNSLEQKINKIKLNKDKFVIIAPEAITCKNLDNVFLESLISQIKNFGYDIFLNTKTETSNILKNTKNTYLTIEEFNLLARYAKGIIAVRSGLIEPLTLLSNTPIVCLYPETNCTKPLTPEQFIQSTTLKQYPFASNNIKELKYLSDFNKDSKLIGEIIDYIRKGLND